VPKKRISYTIHKKLCILSIFNRKFNNFISLDFSYFTGEKKKQVVEYLSNPDSIYELTIKYPENPAFPMQYNVYFIGAEPI